MVLESPVTFSKGSFAATETLQEEPSQETEETEGETEAMCGPRYSKLRRTHILNLFAR